VTAITLTPNSVVTVRLTLRRDLSGSGPERSIEVKSLEDDDLLDVIDACPVRAEVSTGRGGELEIEE
jgi:hypothetical protein